MNGSIRGRSRFRLAVSVGVLAIAGAAVVISMPPGAREAPSARWQGTTGMAFARGVVHVHTRRSDGSGSILDVAQAAARAGLDFVVLSDHGDGTRRPDPPAYRAGVLMIDAVEVSTASGHLLALGLDEPSPYRLGGAAADVIEDIHRLGGIAIATHPDSARPSLAWHDWDVALDGLEWLNADSEWRDEGMLALAAALTHYWFRGPETIASLFDRPVASLERWDRLLREGRSLVSVAGADAHARLPLWDDTGDADTSGDGLPVPTYEAVFRALSMHVVLERRLTGDARADAARVVDALMRGRSYAVIDGLARGGSLLFSAETAAGPAYPGDRLERGSVRRLRARLRAPVNAEVVLLRDGESVYRSTGLSMDIAAGELPLPRETSGTVTSYRLEVHLDGSASRVPWIVSNPIVERSIAPALATTGEPTPPAVELSIAMQPGATVERDPASRGTLRPVSEGGLELDYRLGPNRRGWVAAAIPLGETVRRALDQDAHLRLRLRAAAPCRVSIQLRQTSAQADLRWQRSVYVSPQGEDVRIALRHLHPVGAPAGGGSRYEASTLLVVVDGVNAAPESAGRLVITAAALERPARVPTSGR